MDTGVQPTPLSEQLVAAVRSVFERRFPCLLSRPLPCERLGALHGASLSLVEMHTAGQDRLPEWSCYRTGLPTRTPVPSCAAFVFETTMAEALDKATVLLQARYSYGRLSQAFVQAGRDCYAEAAAQAISSMPGGTERWHRAV